MNEKDKMEKTKTYGDKIEEKVKEIEGYVRASKRLKFLSTDRTKKILLAEVEMEKFVCERVIEILKEKWKKEGDEK